MHKAVRLAALSVVSMTIAGTLAGSLTGCTAEPPPFDPRQLQGPDRSSATQLIQPPLRPLPTALESLPPTTREVTPTTPIAKPTSARPLGNEPTVRLTLQEIIQRSVLTSREVRVAGYDPAIAETRIIEAEAKFDPVLFANARVEHRDQQTAGQLIPNPANPQQNILLNVERGDIYTLEPGVKEELPSGGQASISYQMQQSEFSPRTFITNPFYENILKLQFDQPLLRQFGFDVNQARITIARNDTRVSILDFRKTLEDNISELEKDYWQLVQAEQDVIAQEELLERTRDTADILIKRFEAGGDVSRVQTSQATASVRSREAALIVSRARLGELSDDIKRRMNDPDFPVAGNVVILSADRPLETAIDLNPEDQVDTALENRYELGQQLLRINSADIALIVAKNNQLPKLDLQTTIGFQGLQGGFHGALEQGIQDAHISYTLGLQFELPIGNREALAISRRARLQREQAIEQYGFLVEQVSQDVKTGLREIESTWETLGSRRQARFAYADSLRAIEQQEEHGEALTPTFVQLKLDSQERLADAQREEAAALANYNISIARLERSKGTLLRYNNVVLKEASLPR